MLLISNSGKTRELLELVELTRGLVPDMKFIVITSNSESSLAKDADVCLLTGAPKEVCPLGLTPTTSNDGDDRYRGYFGGRYDEKDQFQQ